MLGWKNQAEICFSNQAYFKVKNESSLPYSHKSKRTLQYDYANVRSKHSQGVQKMVVAESYFSIYWTVSKFGTVFTATSIRLEGSTNHVQSQ